MNLTGTIESAELKFKQILEEFFISVFDEKSLSSHGIDHHRRVWSYAKELITCIEKQNILIDPALAENLIIACYLHDIGMSIDSGVKHGHHSRDFCEKFLKKNHLNEHGFKNLLSAIENHDNKEYKTSTGHYDLLTILSVADDLDAFGFTGIYRYTDIYLTRGINPQEIGQMIIENAAKRFNHFEIIFRFSDKLIQKYKSRYLILDSFFNNYNKQVPSYQFGGENPSGHCGVIELLQNVIKNKILLRDYLMTNKTYPYDSVINWFLIELKNEIF